MDAAERDEFERNQSTAACCGRDPELKLSREGKEIRLRIWMMEILNNMQGVCEMLDGQILNGENNQDYSYALQAQIEKVRNNSLLPSSQVIEGMNETDQSFFKFALQKSEQHKDYFSELPVSPKRFDQLTEMAAQSINEQKSLEETEQFPFDQYLANYMKLA